MMKQDYTKIKRILALSALALPIVAFAGNIPQYKVEKGGAPYSEISDGTALKMVFNGNAVMFGDGRMFYDSEMTGQGFPIGFDFRLGGQVFDQFIVDNYGNLYLGKEEVGYGTTAFRVGMSTIAYGLYKADVSYKTEGEEGNRVLTVQYKNATLNEQGSSKGKYSLQLRLHEADGKVEMAFKELDTCYAGLGGFATGLRGWDNGDTLWLTAQGLDKPISVSTFEKPNMLDSGSFIRWDKDDYDQGYAPCFVFTPESDTTAPKEAPADLALEQREDILLITCRRGGDAQATVVLISETPFTDEDLPVDGETFRAGRDEVTGEYYTKIGNATVLYYGDDESVTLEVPGLEAGKSYHVCAVSANGYPAYNRSGRAEKTLASSQAAPEAFVVTPAAADAVTVRCEAAYPVIVAATTEMAEGYDTGYTGVFGTPSADSKVGDELPGGGTVVYVGDPGEFEAKALPNRPLYLRAWTLDDTRLSSTTLDGVGLPALSFPYEPAVEERPLRTALLGWEATEEQFIPVLRAYGRDRALMAVTIGDAEVTLTTPPFDSDRTMTLSFEYAMETERDAAVGDEGQVMMQGFGPGDFGETGYLRIRTGGETLREIREYGGTMTGSGTSGYEDGSSTFEEAEVEVPATDGPRTLTFAFSTPKKSRLYLRNITLLQTGPISGIDSVAIDADVRESAPAIYTLTGLRIEGRGVDELPAGLYIVGGKKVVVGK